ncbi:MAG TPA: Gfo/Idh/MocA family oxidoreductase [Gemmatimonadales bacterium]|nr:Gfo/Idh/MocA family oxidoreductase [Gemmatimonadales bacterium]
MARRSISRRTFLNDVGAIGAGALVLPRRVLGGPGYQAPSDALNVAIVGAGGVGMGNAEQVVTQNIVAVCDVDFGYVQRSLAGRHRRGDGTPRPNGIALQQQFARAARYDDFRVMLEKQKDIDAVIVATPDHLHAVIAKAAMELGKHVYVQKPLTWSVHESRVLAEMARRTGVVTQMGNQGHSSDDARLVNEWIAAGVIGPVRQVDIWTNRPIWPQGHSYPSTPAAPPPPGLRWDLYLGPVPEDIAYHQTYHPFNWRGWLAFGVGALGDMGAHLIDHPYWALGLERPVSIEATSTPWGGSQASPVTYPQGMLVHYEFAARGDQPPVRMSWYDGGLMPPRPGHLPDDIEFEREGGVIYLGDRGILMHETYGANPRIWPVDLMEKARAVPKTLPRVGTSHEMNWVAACKGEAKATSPFEYAAPLTETMLLGIAALRAGQGRKVVYDAGRMAFTNAPDADQYLTRRYRDGWSV